MRRVIFTVLSGRIPRFFTSNSRHTPVLLLKVMSRDRILTCLFSSQLKVLYNPQAFFTHAVLLDQGCPHCPIFPTAASRRSLDRVSVPVWLIILSDQLKIVALVSFYLTNKLILRRLIMQKAVYHTV